ncbi:MAG: hypothetical protein K8953_13665, partial [Proteobacteria bacterium]|nr:hypothetical protein [Pseudomonadota bacterium]
DLRVSFCNKVANAGNPACPTQVTAEVWADSFDTPLAHGATAADTSGKFLIGRETDLDMGGLDASQPSYYYNKGNLNFADATFNGVALGGDAEDGMAFFASNRINSYVGILSGTNLGAPLTDTNGTAKWVGSFTYEGTSRIDFVLNVSFGTGAGAGEIEAFVKAPRYIDYHIAGEFDDAGVITGTARQGWFKTPNSNNSAITLSGATGKLTGLIGEEGAVGAYILKDSYGSQYLGGFVARPSSADELQTLTQTCADDPFHKHCNIGYDDERDAILDHCIIGGNANDTTRCGSVRELYLCIEDPFYNTCEARLPEHYQQARANRTAFCRTAGNADNALCTAPIAPAAYQNICRNYPFDAQCRGDNSYRPIRRDA